MMKPRLRFREFKDEWAKDKLKYKFKGIHNAFVGTVTPYYTNEKDGNFYLESNNVKNGKINKNKQIFINNEFHNKQKNKWLHSGDLVMVQSGHIGETAVIPKELNNISAHALIELTDPINTSSEFVNIAFQTKPYKEKCSYTEYWHR